MIAIAYNKHVQGRWALNDPEFDVGLIVGFQTVRELKKFTREWASPGSVMVRLPAPHFHGPWSKWWKRHPEFDEIHV